MHYMWSAKHHMFKGHKPVEAQRYILQWIWRRARCQPLPRIQGSLDGLETKVGALVLAYDRDRRPALWALLPFERLPHIVMDIIMMPCFDKSDTTAAE